MKKDLSELSILIIDDDEFILSTVVMTLELVGVTNVITCKNGLDALTMIDSGQVIDVIMLDLNMPVMDGVEVLRNLALRKYFGDILLFSGEDTRILKSVKNLADEHKLNVLGSLSKPVSANDLFEKLARIELKLIETSKANTELISSEELQKAIAEKQIAAFFEPQINVMDGSLASVEVLARWQHPERGLIPPITFIPLAEEHDLINEMTWHIFEQALANVGQWRKRGYDFSVSVNFSAKSLVLVDLPERLTAIANTHDVPCNMITLEVTESRLLENLATTLDVLTRLRLMGFRLSIDDFGTGYSSMSQLSNIPFTELKIDRSFVHDAADNLEARAILESSVILAKKLNMTIVAEGVENQSDWDQVVDVGCDLVQGYFIARAMSAAQFDAWMSWREADLSQSAHG